MVGTVSQIDVDKSVRWYAEFLENIPLAIYRTTLEGKLLFCNKAFAQLFGFASVGELIGYPVVQLYRNQKDRGMFVEAIIRGGRVENFPLSLMKQDGTPLWCAVTAEVVFDEDGMAVLLDGVIRDITAEIKEKEALGHCQVTGTSGDDFVLLLNLQGDLLDINQHFADLLGFHKEELVGRALFEFIVPQERYLFPLFLSDVLRSGQEEGILTLLDRNGMRRFLGFYAFAVKDRDNAYQIKLVAHDAIERMKHHKHRLSKEKFLGVMEMAGGVAHKLNQPLTIISNLLNEVLSDLSPHDQNYENIVKIDNQIKKLNEIARKIGAIKKYEAMEYVAGVKIVDIDKASRVRKGEGVP
jgi:PAS domain S-box-containing protein